MNAAREDTVWGLQTLRADLGRLPFELIVNRIAASPLVPRVLRMAFYRLAGLRVHTPNLYAHCRIVGSDLHVGRRSLLNRECFVDASGPVRIGRRVHLAMRVSVVTSTHEPGGPESRAGRVVNEGVTVEDGCWIGAGATLLPGSHVRAGTVIAAGAVATGTCGPNAVYGGVPARKIRDL